MKKRRSVMAASVALFVCSSVFQAAPAEALDIACPNNSFTIRLGIPGFGYRDMSTAEHVWLGRANVGGLGTKLMGYVKTGTGTCFAYWVLDSNGNPLTGQWSNYNNICFGSGNDNVEVIPPYQLVDCTNLPTMTAWNYNGYQLMTYLEGGDDTFYGGAGKDNVTAGGGNDNVTLTGGTGDLAYGESGADYIVSASANCYIQGGSENDTIQSYGASSPYDYLNGGTGDDNISDSDWAFSGLDGGPGNDTCSRYAPYGAVNCEYY